MEVMLVMAIIAMLATMMLPKGFFSFDSPMRSLRRVVLELSDMALDGYSVRLRMEVANRADRGQIVVEALTKVQDRFEPAKETLEWTPVQMSNPLEGEIWKLEPEIVYFYSDGTCTPARVLYADKDTRITEGGAVFLTVTGFLFEKKTGGF